MGDFLLHTGFLTLSLSAVTLLVLMWCRVWGRGFSAKSRYTLWTLVIFTLCIGMGSHRLPSLFTFEIPVSSQTEGLSSVTENIPDEKTPGALEGVASPAESDVGTVLACAAVDGTKDTEGFGDANRHPGIGGTTGNTPITDSSEPAHAETPPRRSPVSPFFRAVPYLFGLWLVGATLFFAVNLAVYLRSTRKYSRAKRLCDRETEEIYRAVCRKYRIKQAPALYVCPEVGSPVLYGYIKPTVLLPDLPLSQNALVGVLAHELTHYRRGDIWVKLVCLLAEALYWFNPLVHMAARWCNAEMELSCDEAVLLGMREDVRRSYGNVMLEIVKHCNRRSSLLTTRFNPHKNAVKERLMNILDVRKKKRGGVMILATLLLCLVTGGVIGCTFVGDTTDRATEPIGGESTDGQFSETDRLVYPKTANDPAYAYLCRIEEGRETRTIVRVTGEVYTPVTGETAGTSFIVMDGAVYSADGETLYRYRGEDSFVMPEQVRYIAPKAFFDSGIKQVTFNRGLLYIGNYAFADTPIYEVHLPEGLLQVDCGAFDGCRSAVSGYIPSTCHVIYGFHVYGATENSVSPFYLEQYKDTDFSMEPVIDASFLFMRTERDFSLLQMPGIYDGFHERSALEAIGYDCTFVRIDESNGVLLLTSWLNKMDVYLTHDGGITWTETEKRPTPPEQRLNRFVHTVWTDADTGVFYYGNGYDNVREEPILQLTTDGGKSWHTVCRGDFQSEEFASGYPGSCIRFADFYREGEDLYLRISVKDGETGTWCSSDGGVTWSMTAKETGVDTFRLYY